MPYADRDRITPAEAEAIFKACWYLSSWDTRSNWRWNLLFRALWWTGFRVGEIVQLRPQDLELGVIWSAPLKTKDSRPEAQLVPPEYTRELATYCVQYKVPAGTPIFGVKERRVRQVLDQVAAAAGITRKVNPHLIRAGRAALVGAAAGGLANPTAVQVVKRALRHKGKGSDAALKYLRPSRPEVDAAIKKSFE